MSRTSPADIAAQRRAEEEARFEALYGDALPHVRILQRRGFVVTKEGRDFLVGNKRLTKTELVAMASREASVAGMADPGRRVVTTASGLRVGHQTSLTPKKPKAPAPAPKPKLAPAPRQVVPKPVKPPKPVVSLHSTDLGAKPRVVWLDLGLLTIDKRYQRDIGEGGRAHVAQILKSFNWNCYQPIIVTENADGTYPVIDGQHRLEAAKRHPLIDSLPCYIIDAPEVSKQAQIFVAVNSNRRGLTSAQRFWASHAAGEASAVALADICKANGVTILRGPPGTQIPPLAILGPLVCQRLVVKFGARALREAITLLAESHATTPGAFRSSTIGALVRIAADKAGYSREGLRRVLVATDLSKLLGEAASLISGGGVSSLTLGTEKLLRAKMGRAAA